MFSLHPASDSSKLHQFVWFDVWVNSFFVLKGTAILMISMFYQKELYEPWILIQVSSKWVENGQVMGIQRIQNGQHLAAILNI